MTIHQAILFRNPASETLGPAIWAVFKEVESYLKQATVYDKTVFKRYYFSSEVPGELAAEANFDPATKGGEFDERFWEADATRGLYAGTFELESLATKARGLIGPLGDEDRLVAVTDVELATLPKNFFTQKPSFHDRILYKFWDVFDKLNIVISLAPMDPAYWEREDADSLGTIRRRARSACCRTTCQLLGLDRCTTQGCFMQFPIRGPEMLDGMELLCHKHPQAGGLQGARFPATVDSKPV